MHAPSVHQSTLHQIKKAKIYHFRDKGLNKDPSKNMTTVDTTLLGRQQRCYNVETRVLVESTLCAGWRTFLLQARSRIRL